MQELLNNEQIKSVEGDGKGESESEDESIEESGDESIEESEDSESEDEEINDLNNTNQTGGGIFSILLPLLASTVLPAILKK